MAFVDNVESMIRDYYRAAAVQLKSAAKAAVSNHNGLTGSMREKEVANVLRGLLPQRYALDRGMVYGKWHCSHEADLMVWDAMNYPTINLKDDTPLCFAESVRAVVEVKSVWGEREFEDIRVKCRAVREITMGGSVDIFRRVEALEEHAKHYVKGGVRRRGAEHHHEEFKAPERKSFGIPFVAIMLSGGATFGYDYVTSERVEEVNGSWPTLMLFLETGQVVFKGREFNERGWRIHNELTFRNAGDDALLLFASHLNAIVAQGSSHAEKPFHLYNYCESIIDAIPGKRLLLDPNQKPPRLEVHEFTPPARMMWRPPPPRPNE